MEETIKRCIVYIPYKLEENGNGARMVRPRKMIEAFDNIGYDVFVIQGYSKERAARIKELKKNIENNIKYEFMYSESHTEPTLLTDPNHLPMHPFMDFGFFKYIKKQGIKIGLFYCDIYWKFPEYGVNLSTLKRNVAIWNYKYDIKQYANCLDHFYVPCIKVLKYLNNDKLSSIASELPPGADDINVGYDRDKESDSINIFYVGGLGSHYKIIELFKSVKNNNKCRLTVCCRENEWEKEKQAYEPYLCDRIAIIHKNSYELEPYYKKTDICSLLFVANEYRDMAMPFKAFEYLAYEKPVLATRGTAIGAFTEQNGTGWTLEYSEEKISETIRMILNDSEEIKQKEINCKKVKSSNLWTNRAAKVAKDLCN